MGISNFNKGHSVDWGFSTKGMRYIKIADLMPETTYQLAGCFTTPDNGYGAGAVLITYDGKEPIGVNIPQRYVETVTSICKDPETVKQIKAGKAGFNYSMFTSEKYHRTGYSVDFVDID